MGIFELETVLVGRQFETFNYPEIPLGAWNPGAYIKDGKLVILPRLHFDTYLYVSSVGLCEPLEFSELGEYNYDSRPIKTKLLKYPTEDYEIRGIEDPKITEDGRKILSVGLGKTKDGKDFTTQTIVSDFNGEELTSTKPILFNNSILQTGRDAVLVNDHVLLFRPEIKPLRTYRVFYTETEENIIISKKNLKPLLELDAHKGERKRGISTNVVKLNRNRYIVGYHVAFNEKLEYKEGFMLLDDTGEVLAISKSMLETEGILRYGACPFTLFGCGLVLKNNKLYWVGGIGDSWIGIFSAELDKVMEDIKEKSFI